MMRLQVQWPEFVSEHAVQIFLVLTVCPSPCECAYTHAALQQRRVDGPLGYGAMAPFDFDLFVIGGGSGGQPLRAELLQVRFRDVFCVCGEAQLLMKLLQSWHGQLATTLSSWNTRWTL
eukprot:5433177-Amphidinium_carterae.1